MQEPTPQIIHRIPREHMNREQWNAELATELSKVWESSLTDSECQSWKKYKQGGSPGVVPPSVWQKLDSLIITQAETLGWRLVLCELVLMRFRAWETVEKGDKLFELFGKACGKSVRIIQRREKPPLTDPDLQQFKKETVEELRALLRILRQGSTQKLRPTAKGIAEGFQAMVGSNAQLFPHLRANLGSWTEYLTSDLDVAKLLAAGETRVRPAGLFDAWLAWAKGYDQETVRHHVSLLSHQRPPTKL